MLACTYTSSPFSRFIESGCCAIMFASYAALLFFLLLLVWDWFIVLLIVNLCALPTVVWLVRGCLYGQDRPLMRALCCLLAKDRAGSNPRCRGQAIVAPCIWVQRFPTGGAVYLVSVYALYPFKEISAHVWGSKVVGLPVKIYSGALGRGKIVVMSSSSPSAEKNDPF